MAVLNTLERWNEGLACREACVAVGVRRRRGRENRKTQNKSERVLRTFVSLMQAKTAAGRDRMNLKKWGKYERRNVVMVGEITEGKLPRERVSARQLN